ncbi:MAG: DsrE family protein [Pseudomonadota bacterium]|nr:DsrE family protein [Pseudomonadota bacterium]
MSIRQSFIGCISSLLLSCALIAGASSAAEFSAGPVFQDYGKKVLVEGVEFNANAQFKVAFDVAKGAEPGTLNRRFDSLARFINMHVASGVPAENIELALVVHGSATLDLLAAPAYQQKQGAKNANIALINALMANQVRVIVCGQSAAAHGYANQAFLPGVEVALSAMSAHALLQQQGYTLNPF